MSSQTFTYLKLVLQPQDISDRACHRAVASTINMQMLARKQAALSFFLKLKNNY